MSDQRLMMDISESISHLSHGQLIEIGQMIYDENPEHLRHKSNDGTNVILNRLKIKTLKNIWNYIQSKLTI